MTISQNETINLLNHLRSIHGNFSEKEISQEKLNQILHSCVQAANASNRQSYSIIVIENKETISNFLGFKGNKALLFCVDYNRLKETANYLGHPFESDDFVYFITGTIDTILAAQTAAIAAKSLNIDSLFTNSIHRKDINKVYEKFNLPGKYCFPLISLILGFPQEEPKKKKGRLQGKGIIHKEKYQTLSDEEKKEIIEDYNDPEKALGLINDWEDKGFENYLDWFFEVWSIRQDKKEKAEEIKSILKKVNFLSD